MYMYACAYSIHTVQRKGSDLSVLNRTYLSSDDFYTPTCMCAPLLYNMS